MNNNRLGCLSPMALIALLVTLITILGLEYTSGNSFFSPGSLNAQTGTALGGVTSHAEIGADCAKCHPAPWSSDVLANRCLVCHTDILAQLRDLTSMHGTMMKGGNLVCHNCHPDHRGPNASLTNLDMSTFPHATVGYSLRAHQRLSSGLAFTCADCHVEGISKFDLAICTACHQQMESAFMQAHTLAYGNSCLTCHDGLDSLGKRFSHANLSFKLDGKHAGLTCSKCHANARAVADFKSASTVCVDCHQKDDKHNGQFGQDCGACHTPTNWNDATFDHSLAAFKLDGAHVNVACEKCHVNNVFKGAASACSICHQDPAYHAGMFPGQACSACHITSAWQPAKYAGPHTFPMNHGEKNNTCADCHQPTLTTWTCYTCHDQGEVVQKHQEERISNFDDCLRCHATGQKEEGEGDGEGGDHD